MCCLAFFHLLLFSGCATDKFPGILRIFFIAGNMYERHVCINVLNSVKLTKLNTDFFQIIYVTYGQLLQSGISSRPTVPRFRAAAQLQTGML
jgi:hypothetical protein